MSYRNKTYVAFASEDIHCYRLMEAWRDNEHIEFDFLNAHDLTQARDTSSPETIRRSLRTRLANTKQVVVLGSRKCRSKAGDGGSFLFYEIDVISRLKLPVVIANLNGGRSIDRSFIPQRFLDEDYYTMSVSFQSGIIKYALNEYAPRFATSSNVGPHYYLPSVYTSIGI